MFKWLIEQTTTLIFVRYIFVQKINMEYKKRKNSQHYCHDNAWACFQSRYFDNYPICVNERADKELATTFSRAEVGLTAVRNSTTRNRAIGYLVLIGSQESSRRKFAFF
jgi:hypothetical protein